ncbi:methylenetetrahydrofolate reductase C-terminal domain-containing protein [uncultured Alsobacter sp.]|uniref:methylenetetrahydrofolate reductase C-terminal domain-containing protein n=1 Tax=uncultured Alsobacter sp. TaxID=1748258 RepID=UPI0025DCC175|nr:methylenetetrahydrofolate reductase C-terminal domain-containing protein [uncultured Alsobacter sp.]
MLTPAAFEPRGKLPPRDGSSRLRFWSVRHARGLERLYAAFERVLRAVAPLARKIGLERLERPVAAVEATVKGALFDCRMCGQCALSSTGLSCPMNCPKNLRNGPCGGVRQDGHCEVYPQMPCVWVQAWEGSQRMKGGEAIRTVQPPIDHRLKGRSSWLSVVAQAAPAPEAKP